ncbi:hypothetical protein [Telluribacter sp.]|jgi:hypothetical protein|uniref:hypothetical protein n=1 Tax=Telluribacter sp. TaxID=1978767 RepID=UPI002E151D22|nr:hypothetical protein [Telluribacter sp.]
MKSAIRIILLFLLISSLSRAGVTVENGLSHTHKGNWGDVLTGTIKLVNSGKKDERVLIFKNDLLQGCDDRTAFAEVNSHSRSSGSWIKLNVSEWTLRAGESYEVVYSMAIPRDTTFRGSYWSLLMVEVVDPIREEKTSLGVSIGSKLRYAVQVITDVGPTSLSEITYQDIKLQKQPNGGTTIQVVLKNNGIFLVNPTLVLELYNRSEEKVKKMEVPFRNIYPQSCKLYEVAIEGVPKGSYKCVLVVNYGRAQYGMNASLKLD